MTNQTQVVATNLNQVLIETIQQVKGGIGKGVDFAMEQVPEVCQQLLVWKFAEAVAIVASMVLLVALCGWATWRFRKQLKWLCWDDSLNMVHPGVAAPGFAWLILLVMFFMTVPPAASDAIKIKLAPKVYLIEYVSNLIK